MLACGRVPDFSFQVSYGKFSNAGIKTVFENGAAARQGALAIFADLARDIATNLMIDPKWRLQLIDKMGKPVFEITIVANELAALIPENAPTPLARAMSQLGFRRLSPT
jgi:hypothetical protein